jgi:hypothetical protein
VNFQIFRIRPLIVLTLLPIAAAVAIASCGGGGSAVNTPNRCAQQYGGGGGGGGGAVCPTPKPAVSAAPVALLLTGENPVNIAPYGNVLGYSNGTAPSTPNGSGVVMLTANTNVVFTNVEANGGLPHTASSLGPWSGSFPASGPSSSALNASAAGTSISAAGFSTGNLNPGQSSAVYSSGSPAMTVFGCFYHYALNSMRTVVIVQ